MSMVNIYNILALFLVISYFRPCSTIYYSSICKSASVCNYGSQPAVWLSQQNVGERLHILRNNCALKNYASHLPKWAQNIKSVNSLTPGSDVSIRILFLSDSTGAYVVTDICNYFGGKPITFSDMEVLPLLGQKPNQTTSQARIIQCEGALNGSLKIMVLYLPGVHGSGPYHHGPEGTKGLNAKQWISDSLSLWKRYVGPLTALPQVVVTSALYWDLARMAMKDPNSIFRPYNINVHTPLNFSALPPLLHDSTVASWRLNFSSVLAWSRQVYGGATIHLTHTFEIPKSDFKTNLCVRPHLLRPSYTHQLNEEIRKVAHQLCWSMVDYYGISSLVEDPNQRLRDDLHLSQLLNLEIFNIYLNHLCEAAYLQWSHHCNVNVQNGMNSELVDTNGVNDGNTERKKGNNSSDTKASSRGKSSLNSAIDCIRSTRFIPAFCHLSF